MSKSKTIFSTILYRHAYPTAAGNGIGWLENISSRLLSHLLLLTIECILDNVFF